MSAGTDPTGLREVDPGLAAVYAEINRRVALLPDAPDDGGVSIYEELLAAGRWEDLNSPYSGKSILKWNGRELILDGMHKMPSTANGPLDWYVVAHGATSDTGDEAVLVTSSRSAVIQLATAYIHEWMPLIVIPRVAARPSARGYHAHNLEIRGVLAPARTGGA